MLMVQMKKVLLNNQYTVLGFSRSFNDNGDECLEICFAGPADRIPDKYMMNRASKVYADKNGSIIIEMN